MSDENPAPAPTPAPAPSPEPKTNAGAPTAADLRAEAAAYRIEARKAREALEAAERERDEAKGSLAKAVEREQQKAAERLQKTQKRLIESQLKAEAVKAGLEDLDLLPLISRDGLKLNDDDEAEGIEDAIQAFKKAKPQYFQDSKKSDKSGAGSAAGGSGSSPPPRTGSPRAPAPEPNPAPIDVRNMDKQQYRQWKAHRRGRLHA